MAEYIKKEALLEDIKAAEQNGGMGAVVAGTLIRYVKRQPKADVAPVRRGRWIGQPLCGNDNCRCSECGFYANIHVNLSGAVMQKFCPNCGAYMGGADNGE